MKKIMPFVFMFCLFPAVAMAGGNVKCYPPYNPTNIFKILLFYKSTLPYITNAPFSCKQPFVMKIEQIVRSTMILPDGCIQAVFRDIEKAELRRHAAKSK